MIGTTLVGIFSTIPTILNSKLLVAPVEISPHIDNALFYPQLPNFTNWYFLWSFPLSITFNQGHPTSQHRNENNPLRIWRRRFCSEVCHTRFQLFKEMFRNSAGIVGLERATHVKATRNVTKKGTLQKIPAIVQWGLHERKSVALKAHSHAVALTLLGV